MHPTKTSHCVSRYRPGRAWTVTTTSPTPAAARPAVPSSSPPSGLTAADAARVSAALDAKHAAGTRETYASAWRC